MVCERDTEHLIRPETRLLVHSRVKPRIRVGVSLGVYVFFVHNRGSNLESR